MPKDIGEELDAIFAHHKNRVGEARSETVGKSAAEEQFARASAVCLAEVIAPTLRQMAHALNERGVAARVFSDGTEARIDIPVSRHVRLGQGFGGYPYLRARPDRHSRRMQFEQNAAGSQGASRAGDYPIVEVDADLVKEKVMALVREIYAPF